MNYEPSFPKNKAFYEPRHIETFKELIDQSEQLYHDRPAYKLKNKDGVYYKHTSISRMRSKNTSSIRCSIESSKRQLRN